MNADQVGSSSVVWTHPVVVGYAMRSGETDPLAAIEREARELVLQRLDDDRVPELQGPNPRRGRERYEAALRTAFALLGAPCGDGVPGAPREDEWQLRVVCDVAAGELLLAPGALPSAEAARPSLDRLLDVRRRLGVTTESVLRRTMVLTDAPAAAFVAQVVGDGSSLRVEHFRASRAWPASAPVGRLVSAPVWLAHPEQPWVPGRRLSGPWALGGLEARAEAVALDGKGGTRRVAGLLHPLAGASAAESLRYGSRRTGSAERQAAVIDVTLAAAADGADPDGRVEVVRDVDGLTLRARAAVRDGKHRLGLRAVSAALRAVGALATETGAEVSFPMLRGADRARWPAVRDLLVGELSARSVPVRIELGDTSDETPSTAQPPDRTAPVSV